MTRESAIQLAANSVATEAQRAASIHPPFSSLHEGFGVLYEEVHEFMLAIHAHDKDAALREITQVGGVATRILAEFSE